MRSDPEFAELIASIECSPFIFDSVCHCVTVSMPCTMFGSDVRIRAQRLCRVDQPDDEVLADCLTLAAGLLVHELQEHFKVNGETWRDPHTHGNVFNFTTNPQALSVTVSAPPEAPPDVPAAHRLDTGWQPNSTSTVSYWPTADPRRQRPATDRRATRTASRGSGRACRTAGAS